MLALYARLLRLYPHSFRDRFGAEMLQLIRDEVAHGRRVPWLRTFADLFRSALTNRWEEARMKRKLLIIPAAVLLALVAPVLVVGSTVSLATLLILLVEAAIAGVVAGAALVIGRHSRGAEFDYNRRRFHWWFVPAALIGAAETVMIVKQFVDEPKTTSFAAMLIVCAFAGLLFAGLAVRNRRAGNWMIAVGVLPITMLFWLIYPAVAALVVIIFALADNVAMKRVRADAQTA